MFRVIFLNAPEILSLTKEIEEQLKVQRDKLLDLSGNNRLVDFKFKIKDNARSQNYLRIVDEVPEFIIDKLNVDRRFEVIPNKIDKELPYELDLKLKSQIGETLPQYKDFNIQTHEIEPIFSFIITSPAIPTLVATTGIPQDILSIKPIGPPSSLEVIRYISKAW